MCAVPRSERLLMTRFQALSGLPCWGVRQGYGSFVWLNFGQPHLDVRVPTQESKFASQRRRSVAVEGDYCLWIEQCEWRIVDGDQELAHSESDDTGISQALGQLEGALLKEIHVIPGNGDCSFLFEYNLSVHLKRYSDFELDDPIWNLYSPGSATSFLASGRLEDGKGDEVEPKSICCAEARFTL